MVKYRKGVRREYMVDRKKLKHYFLKKILFRVDYAGLLDSDVEKIVSQLRPVFYRAGFINFKEEHNNQLNIQFNIDMSSQSVNASQNDLDKLHIYHFYNEKNENILLSKKYLILDIEINTAGYSFDHYVNVLGETISCLNDVSEYSKPIRIGIQKTNVMYLSDLSQINNYFSKLVFNSEELTNLYKDYTCFNFNSHLDFRKDSMILTCHRNIQEGQMSDEKGEIFKSYQIILDYLVYNENTNDIINLLKDKCSNEEYIKELNDIEFELYKKSLTSEFIEKLKQENFTDYKIGGVI